MVVAGGKGTLSGPLVGALVFTALPEALRAATSWQWQMLAYGVLLVLLVFFLPRGIVPTLASWRAGHTARTAGLARPLDAPAESPPDAATALADRDRGRSPPPGNILEVRDLAVHFGGVAALAGVSFDVRPGTITSLIGPNGAGKTTAFNAITGYLRPTRGRIGYRGASLIGLRPSEVARRGVVRTFQKTSVFPALTVADNVMIGLHLRGRAGAGAVLIGRRRARAEDARLAAEASAIIASVGLSHRRDEVASALPYGEQRLVDLAVALAARPALLLLDEPAAGMTGGEKDAMAGLIRSAREQGVTVLLVEHDMRMVMGISDTVIVLNHGVVIAEGPPAAVQSHPDVIRAYLGVGPAGPGAAPA
jgi:branched-chain amino acid transport system ATP-binding protein